MLKDTWIQPDYHRLSFHFHFMWCNLLFPCCFLVLLTSQISPPHLSRICFISPALFSVFLPSLLSLHTQWINTHYPSPACTTSLDYYLHRGGTFIPTNRGLQLVMQLAVVQGSVGVTPLAQELVSFVHFLKFGPKILTYCTFNIFQVYIHQSHCSFVVKK